MNKGKKCFLVTCHRGHCGTKQSTTITFAIRADNLLTATKIARKMPSVKHSKGIICGKEVSELEYHEYRKKSAYERAGY